MLRNRRGIKKEREEQKANGQVPKYSGVHRDLTPEQQEKFEAEGRQPSIRFQVPESKTYKFNDIVRDEIGSSPVTSATGLS